jgi:hypothetical protein
MRRINWMEWIAAMGAKAVGCGGEKAVYSIRS